jgi:hypothetical protein
MTVVTETHSQAGSSRSLSRDRRTAASSIVAVIATVALLTGCAAGRDAQTVAQKPAVDGVSADSGTLGIRAAAVEAPITGSSYAKGEDAPLQLVLVNNGTADDTLTAVTVGTSVATSVSTGLVGPPDTAASASSSASAANVPIPVPANSSVKVGFSAIGPSIILTKLTAALFPAQPVPQVVFSFASGATITATLPVQITSGGSAAPTVDINPTNEG